MKKIFITVFMVLGLIALTHCGENTHLDPLQGAQNSVGQTGTITSVHQAP